MRKRRQNQLLNSLNALNALQREHDELHFRIEIQRARKELLEATIHDHDQVSAFKRSTDMRTQQLGMGDAASGQEPGSDSGSDADTLQQNSSSYVLGLLSSVLPDVVHTVLNWQALDWHNWLADAASKVCLLVQLVDRSSAGSTQPLYVSTVEQDLNKAVDEIVTIGVLGAIYAEVTGRQLGICTSLNHITLQEEAPPQDHWQNVMQQLELSRPQLVMLTACYQEFMRQRKAHQVLQESLTKPVASTSSCTQRLLAAAQGCPVAGAAAGAVTGDSSTQEAVCRASSAGSSGRLAGSAEPVSPGADDSEGSDIAAAVSHSEYLSTRLLVRMNQSFSMPFLVLHNTLTRKQIARMLVSSYPFAPRPGPLMEAAAQYLVQLRAGKEAEAAAAAEADAMQEVQE